MTDIMEDLKLVSYVYIYSEIWAAATRARFSIDLKIAFDGRLPILSITMRQLRHAVNKPDSRQVRRTSRSFKHNIFGHVTERKLEDFNELVENMKHDRVTGRQVIVFD